MTESKIIIIFVPIAICTVAPENHPRMGKYVLPAFDSLEEMRKYYPEPIEYMTVEGMYTESPSEQPIIKEVN